MEPNIKIFCFCFSLQYLIKYKRGLLAFAYLFCAIVNKGQLNSNCFKLRQIQILMIINKKHFKGEFKKKSILHI